MIGRTAQAAFLALGLTAWAVPLAAADETVIIRDTLRPAVLEIEAGTTVTWVNRDGERHRMRSKDGPERFDSKNLDRGEAYGFTFSMPGEYPYYDHRNRNDNAYFGTIVVADAAGFEAAPTDTAEVAIVDDAFATARVSITPGGTVTWTNRGADEHTASAADGSFESGILAPGASFATSFEVPGEYA